jgi:hypothetical protein
MWISLADGGQSLKASLEHNIIWSDQEKEWFSHIKSEEEGVKYVLNYVLPSQLKPNADLISFAATIDIRWVAGRYL